LILCRALISGVGGFADEFLKQRDAEVFHQQKGGKKMKKKEGGTGGGGGGGGKGSGVGGGGGWGGGGKGKKAS
jgi:hypothetical protein